MNVPRALVVEGGDFVALGSELGTTPSEALPSACLERLPVASRETGEELDGELSPITVCLTVDTEDAYFQQPRLMTGEGIGADFGVFGILDELDERGLRATFFVNVFEADRQPPSTVRGVVTEIADRGHEVALHTHPAPELPWYDKPLFRKTRDDQTEILKRGRTMLQDWSEQPVGTFRAGGYAINDDTLVAMSAAGLRIDSSVFFPSPNNHNRRFTINAPRLAGEVVEAPVTYVIRAGDDGSAVEHRKLDLDWLGPEQLVQAITRLRASRVDSAVFMMHSFSFLQKASLPPEQAPSAHALFTSQVLFNRYVEIYGPKPEARAAFAFLLDELQLDTNIRLAPLRDAEDQLRAAAARGARDVVPVVLR